MKKSILLIFLLRGFIGSVALAQNREISGKVTAAADGFGMPGANVVVRDTKGTITDIDGVIGLTCPRGTTRLWISFIGYANKEIKYRWPVWIDVQLEEDIQQLSEVVVVGYGEHVIAKRLPVPLFQ